MEIITAENLSFTYNSSSKKVIDNIDFSIKSGEFVLLCGASGSGKTTFLRCLKPNISPAGKKKGSLRFWGEEDLTEKDVINKIGFVFQNPEEQIVCDRVFSELAFGLENMGLEPSQIRRRIAEISAFFGMEKWFSKKTYELSGGQKQLLNLASVMALQPEILLLDEPLARLDPISAGKFVNMLERINKELGLTVIVSEHNLDDLLPYADRICIMDNGQIIFDDEPRTVAGYLLKNHHPMSLALPSATIIGSKATVKQLPITVKECKNLLKSAEKTLLQDEKMNKNHEIAFKAKNLSFAYEKSGRNVIENMNLIGYKGELLSIFGENGSGKSTLMKLLAGTVKPQRGKVKKLVKQTAYLPQETTYAFLDDVFGDDIKRVEKSFNIRNKPNFDFFSGIEDLMEKNPLDMSGGERQKAALYKLLMTEPELLLLDEPTKGLDAFSKQKLSKLLNELKCRGVCIVMVTHDMEFAAKHSDRCAMVFGGDIVSIGGRREFFCENTFFTTHARRISKGIIENAITCEEVIECAAES